MFNYYFYAAPGDSISVKILSKRKMDGVYVGKYEQRPFLSEVYVKDVEWKFFSDTLNLYFLTVLQSGLWEFNRVSINITRKPTDSAYINFNTKVVFKKKEIFYEDTLLDTTFVFYRKWRFMIPAISSSIYGALFDGEPVFTFEGKGGILIWLAPTEYDDSVRFSMGESFLENGSKREQVCKNSQKFGNLNLYILRYGDYYNNIMDPIKRINNISRGCFFIWSLPAGKYTIVIENKGAYSVGVSVRLIFINFKPIIIKKYKVITVPVKP